ncbi:MAG: DinB family protein [Proteobacteria bacterium]|nr:DinB family protein [Pseudomonadota bacterium]
MLASLPMLETRSHQRAAIVLISDGSDTASEHDVRDVKTLLREQFKSAHGILEGTMQDVTEEQAQWSPPGKAIPLGATYAHAVMSEDAMLNGMVKGAAPLFATTFAGKTGLGENPPAPDQPWETWSRSVKIDLGALRAYAKAVYASTDEYLGSAGDDELAREMDLSGLQMGKQSVACHIRAVSEVVNRHLAIRYCYCRAYRTID